MASLCYWWTSGKPAFHLRESEEKESRETPLDPGARCVMRPVVLLESCCFSELCWDGMGQPKTL